MTTRAAELEHGLPQFPFSPVFICMHECVQRLQQCQCALTSLGIHQSALATKQGSLAHVPREPSCTCVASLYRPRAFWTPPSHRLCFRPCILSPLARFLTHSTGQGALKLILISDWLSLGCSSAIAPSVSCTPCRTLPFLSMCLQKRINQHQHRHQRHTLGSCDVNMHTSLRGECRWQSASRMTKMSPRRRLALGPSPPSL